MSSDRPQEDRRGREEPVSLAPLDPEEALRALLRVRPGDLPADDRASEDEKPAETESGPTARPGRS